MDQRSSIGHEDAGQLSVTTPRLGFSLLRLPVPTRRHSRHDRRPAVGLGLAVGARMTQEKPPAISFHDLTLGYDRHPAVHHITGEVARGDLLAVVGPNGAGKSTLLKGIVGLLKPLAGPSASTGSSGATSPICRNSRARPQLPDHGVRPVSPGSLARDRAVGGIDRDGRTRGAARRSPAVGLKASSERRIGTLSGGQLQRALFARLLLQDARDHPARRAVQRHRHQDRRRLMR